MSGTEPLPSGLGSTRVMIRSLRHDAVRPDRMESWHGTMMATLGFHGPGLLIHIQHADKMLRKPSVAGPWNPPGAHASVCHRTPNPENERSDALDG